MFNNVFSKMILLDAKLKQPYMQQTCNKWVINIYPVSRYKDIRKCLLIYSNLQYCPLCYCHSVFGEVMVVKKHELGSTLLQLPYVLVCFFNKCL